MIRIWFVDHASDMGGSYAYDRKIPCTMGRSATDMVHAAYAQGFFVVPLLGGTREFIPWHAVFNIIEEKEHD